MVGDRRGNCGPFARALHNRIGKPSGTTCKEAIATMQHCDRFGFWRTHGRDVESHRKAEPFTILAKDLHNSRFVSTRKTDYGSLRLVVKWPDPR
jgi:hypothetical protein